MSAWIFQRKSSFDCSSSEGRDQSSSAERWNCRISQHVSTISLSCQYRTSSIYLKQIVSPLPHQLILCYHFRQIRSFVLSQSLEHGNPVLLEEHVKRKKGEIGDCTFYQLPHPVSKGRNWWKRGRSRGNGSAHSFGHPQPITFPSPLVRGDGGLGRHRDLSFTHH